MATWKIDTAHSEVKFKVKHLVVSTVTGHFTKFDGTVDSEKDDFTDAKISFEADVDSIDTRNAQRDGHLKSADFFDAANHPKITFASTSLGKKDGGNYELTGNLTLRGVTKEIKLHVAYNGIVKGFDGADVAGFEITGTVKRMEYGLQWNGITEAGGIAVSDDVKIEINVELKKA